MEIMKEGNKNKKELNHEGHEAAVFNFKLFLGYFFRSIFVDPE